MITPMKRTALPALACFLATALACFGVLAQETTDTGALSETKDTRVEGEWPARMKPVTLKLEDATVLEALRSTASQAGIGLIIADNEAAASRRVTIQLVRKPAREVVELLLGIGDLGGRFDNGILVVALPAAADSPSPDPPSPETATDRAALSEEVGSVVEDTAATQASAAEADTGDEARSEAEITVGPEGLSVRAGRGKHHNRSHGHKKERVQLGKSLRVAADEEVDSAVVVGGSLTVAGHVLEDAVAVGGSVTLEPGAVVDGNAVAVGGAVDVQPGATLVGDRVGVGGPFGDIVAKGLDGYDLPFGTIMVLHILSKLMRVAVLFVLGLLIVSFAPRRYARIRDYMTRRPGKSALAGVIIMLAVVPLCILFLVTVIGIPLIPFVLLALMALVVFGLTAFLSWLGDKVPLLKGRKTPVIAFAIGLGMFFLISLLPMVGSAVLTAVSFFGAGAAFLSRFGAPTKDSPVDPLLPGEPATV